jgi:RimJ/RimL family protein N-acetyltransferase
MALRLRTPRLLLREWRPEDADAFGAMSADAEVMELLLGPFDRATSDRWVAAAGDAWRAQNFGQWVVELPGEAPFIGVVGLSRVGFEAHFTPAVEAAWRLIRPCWGRGFAYEAARAAIEDGFYRVGLAEIVAITTPPNFRSWRLMERLGMVRDVGGDFDHPRVPEGHRLRRHVLYRLRRPRNDR